MPAEIRPALQSDVDALVEIENRQFSSDRISRRSFRQLIDSATADTLVAEAGGRVRGYCIILYRAGSGVARLYSIAALPGGGEAWGGRALLAAAEQAAYDEERLLLRLEVREDNARAIALYEENGYRRIGREDGYYQDGMAALRYEKLLRGSRPPRTSVPYFPQSVDFTCGPCCLMMALARFRPGFEPSQVMEIRLWREATTVFMMSGPGGCEPFGLAVTAWEHGLSAEILVTHHGALFLQSVRSAEKRMVMELAQADFRARAAQYGIPVAYRAFTPDDIRAALAAGRLVLVLVSGFLMFGEKVPHWVLVVGGDDDHFIVHDPWVEDKRDEAKIDAAAIPVPHQVFYGMAQFGRMRAAVILGERPSP